MAAASNLTFAMGDIRSRFEADTGHTLRVSLGSSGNFYGQIRNGAPFDVFLSADEEYPIQLAAAGLANDTPFIYAHGRIVVWTGDAALDVDQPGMAALSEGTGKVAIANPRLAPYGRAAREAMDYYGVADRLAARLVLGESISQAAQFVQSGAAEVGIVALSVALSTPMRDSGHYWTVPQQAHAPIVQSGVILSRAEGRGHLAAAHEFVSWLLGGRGQEVLGRWGLALAARGMAGR